MTASGHGAVPTQSMRGSTRGTGEWHVITAIFDTRKSELFVDGGREATGKNVGNNRLDGLSIGCDHSGVFFLMGSVAEVRVAGSYTAFPTPDPPPLSRTLRASQPHPPCPAASAPDEPQPPPPFRRSDSSAATSPAPTASSSSAPSPASTTCTTQSTPHRPQRPMKHGRPPATCASHPSAGCAAPARGRRPPAESPPA